MRASWFLPLVALSYGFFKGGLSQNNGDLRLSEGSISSTTYTSGRLEIFLNGQWGTVCDDSFGTTDAKVACQQLGFSGVSGGPINAIQGRFGSGSGHVWLDNVGCTGSESCLLSCGNQGIGSHDCDHSEDVAIFCSGTSITSTDCSFIDTTPCTNGDVRLQGSSNGYEGRVEICDNSAWGTVCDDSWGTPDANVVCRQLGFASTGAIPHRSAYFGEGTGPIILDDVRCTGTENQLVNCPHTGIGIHNCRHIEDAGVTCRTPCTNGDIRLRGSPKSYEGRVEVCNDNAWGTVCDDLWGTPDANVACRQLGFNSIGAIALSSAYFGPGTGSILLDDVQCTGTEIQLVNCPHTGIGIHDCLHSEDAGVTCRIPTLGVSMHVSSPFYIRNRVTITCSIYVDVSVLSNVTVLAVWKKLMRGDHLTNDNRTNISEAVLVGGSSVFESNVTFDRIEMADSGDYTCEATLASVAGNLSSNSTTITITVQTPPTALFQLRLIGVGRCSEWLSELSTPVEKLQIITSAIVVNTKHMCHCGFTTEDISNTGLKCFGDNPDKVTFRGKLSTPVPYVNISTVLSYLTEWIESGASINVDEVALEADPSCSVEIQSFVEQECQSEGGTTSGMIAPAVGGAIAVAIIVIAVALMIVMATKYCYNRHRRYSPSTRTVAAANLSNKELQDIPKNPDDISNYEDMEKDDNIYATVDDVVIDK